MTQPFTIETFSKLVNTKFKMQYGNSQAVELELISATDLGSTPRQIQFSLIMLGPENAPLMQGIYKLEHEKLGALDLFLVPIGKDQSGVSYEAVFNRFVE